MVYYSLINHIWVCQNYTENFDFFKTPEMRLFWGFLDTVPQCSFFSKKFSKEEEGQHLFCPRKNEGNKVFRQKLSKSLSAILHLIDRMRLKNLIIYQIP